MLEALEGEANLAQEGGTALNCGKRKCLTTGLLHLVHLIWRAVDGDAIAQVLPDELL